MEGKGDCGREEKKVGQAAALAWFGGEEAVGEALEVQVGFATETRRRRWRLAVIGWRRKSR